MSIDSPDELAALRAAGRVVAETIRELARRVRPGVTTQELDDVAGKIFAAYGARSGPQLDYDFPGVTCISVDDEAVHGIPSQRRLREGQLVKLDVTAELDGFYADACRTVPVGRVEPRQQRLVAAAQSALKPRPGGRQRGQQRRRDRRRRAGRGAAPRLQRLRGADRPRHRPPDPRGAQRAERRLGRPGADQRPGDHDRADHRRRLRRRLRGRRRLDDPHRRRLALGACRAHDRHHRGRARSCSRHEAPPAASGSAAWG